MILFVPPSSFSLFVPPTLRDARVNVFVLEILIEFFSWCFLQA
jgi:hypothetical protein